MVSINDLKTLIQQQNITIIEASKKLDLPKTQIEKWAELLEEEGVTNKKGMLSFKEDSKELKLGTIYIINEDSKINVYDYLKDKKFKTKLLITRENPKKIIKEQKLVKTDIYWLTNTSSEENCINPSGLVDIEGLLDKKFEDKKKSLIVIDTINFIIEFNDFTEVLHVIQRVRDVLSNTEDILILKVNKRSLEDKQYAKIKAECEEIE